MTLNAISRHTGVIERRAGETGCVMAHVALCRRRNVSRRFPACDDAVVTSGAHANHVAMVNSEWRPRIRIVARFATISGIDMGG